MRPAIDIEIPPARKAAPRARPFAVGDVVSGSYRIESVLGIGAMGAVYEATDLALRRHVAIKAPLLPAMAQSLRGEAQALAAVHHPAFAEVHALEEHGGVPYIVMERLFGETLASRIEDGRDRIPFDEIVDVLVAIADGLAAAHRAGIVHRDLKPSNVILATGRVVLIDLGLFVPDVLIGPEIDAAGSPFWVAPEILLGTAERGRGALADLYSLGAVAYELVTGERAFDGEHIDQVAALHVAGPVPDPSLKRPDTPAALASLIRELLAKEPRDRPPSAEAVVWQLEAIRGRLPMSSRIPSVLVVDDDALVGMAVRRALAQAYPALDVRYSSEPVAALPVGEQPPADVVVVDLDMPQTNGLEICMALRELAEARRPAVVVMSGHAEARDVAVLEALGIASFVPKDERLLAAVGDAVGRLRHRRSPSPPSTS